MGVVSLSRRGCGPGRVGAFAVVGGVVGVVGGFVDVW